MTDTSITDISSTLQGLSRTCQSVIDSYWSLHYQFKKYDYCITIPLIVTSGFTSIAALAQIIGGHIAIQVITLVLSMMVTILASMQKYLEYDRRSVTAKQVAKRWGSLKSKIDFFLISISTIRDERAVIIIVNSVFHEIDSIGGTVEDLPDNINLNKDLNNIKSAIAFNTYL